MFCAGTGQGPRWVPVSRRAGISGWPDTSRGGPSTSRGRQGWRWQTVTGGVDGVAISCGVEINCCPTQLAIILVLQCPAFVTLSAQALSMVMAQQYRGKQHVASTSCCTYTYCSASLATACAETLREGHSCSLHSAIHTGTMDAGRLQTIGFTLCAPHACYNIITSYHPRRHPRHHPHLCHLRVPLSMPAVARTHCSAPLALT